ncbi:hypothetical protein E1162_10765 [Rhodobacteraceae bacterium RKSG542]|nr:hypothetical protein [Pseudovibrio flavus]
MGAANMFNTMFSTAHGLLMNTVLYIMGICVLAGAIGRLLLEFGTVAVMERVLRPLMRPLYRLPGKASLAAVMTFFSDNPAIISLANDARFAKSFKAYQLVSLANFGTAFGMGLIVVTFMSAQSIGGESAMTPALIGLFGAIVGSVVSTRLMQHMIYKDLGERDHIEPDSDADDQASEIPVSGDTIGLRFLNSCLDGGKSGVDLGIAIIPGVLIIATVVMMLTFGPGETGYTGAAFQGVAVLPKLGSVFSGVFSALFGFQSPELIAFPITSLGAVGAAMTLVPPFITQGIIGGNEIAVFTAMGMCWSGYLSTHTAMLDTLGYRNLISKALLSHTIGGLAAGIAAHYTYLLFSLFS